MSNPFKVLIIGGGVGGPALAHWLSRIGGADITLIERARHVRDSGQQVDIRAQAVPLMRKMGIEAAVQAVTVHEPGMQLIDRQGQTKAYFPAAPSGSGRQSFTAEIEIMRGDLVRILYGLTEKSRNVRHLFDTSVDSFTQDDESEPNGKVHVKFEDGRIEDYDLVVGADGTRSRTRKIMLGPDAPDPRHHLGGYIGYFSIVSKPGDSDRATFCLLPGARVGRVVGTRKDHPDHTRVYMIIRGSDAGLEAAHKSGNLAELKKAWAEMYQDGGWECDRFMEALRHAPEADDLYCTPFEEVRLPQGSWSKGRVVLVGDSAHSQTAGGFGCTWALLGAYVLAGEIASLYTKDQSSPSTVVQAAAKAYEEKFRPIATSTHGGSRRWESLLFPKSSFGVAVIHAIVGVAAFFKLGQADSMDSQTSKWLPEYPELERNGEDQEGQ